MEEVTVYGDTRAYSENAWWLSQTGTQSARHVHRQDTRNLEHIPRYQSASHTIWVDRTRPWWASFLLWMSHVSNMADHRACSACSAIASQDEEYWLHNNERRSHVHRILAIPSSGRPSWPASQNARHQPSTGLTTPISASATVGAEGCVPTSSSRKFCWSGACARACVV